MALGAIEIRIRRALNQEQQEDVMEEINMVVNRHIKNAKASRPGIFSRAPTATVTQHQMPHHQQGQQHQGQTFPPCQAFRIFSTSHFNIMNLKPCTRAWIATLIFR